MMKFSQRQKPKEAPQVEAQKRSPVSPDSTSFEEARDQLDHAARLARYRAREVQALERLADAAERIAGGMSDAPQCEAGAPPAPPAPPENIRVKGGGRWPKPGAR